MGFLEDLVPQGGPELTFPVEELERRTQAVRGLMAAAGLDVLVVSNPSNLAYLTGLATAMPSVLARLVVPREGELRLLCASAELPTVLRTSSISPSCLMAVDWLDPTGTVRALAGAITAADSGPLVVGAELTAPEAFASGALDAGTYLGLLRHLPGARIRDASALVLEARLLKSPLEIECMRTAGVLTAVGLDAARDAVVPGARESDVAGAALAAMARGGSQASPMGPMIIGSERSGWGTHLVYDARGLVEGPVFVELTGTSRGYVAPGMTTAVLGRSDDVTRRLASATIETLERLVGAIRPGRTGDDVARAARGPLARVTEAWFHGAYGYSVGLATAPSWTEAPCYLADGAERELEPGMAFSLAICAMVPGTRGVGFGVTVLVTPNGCEPLSPLPSMDSAAPRG